MLLRNAKQLIHPRITTRNSTLLRVVYNRRHNSHDSPSSQNANDLTQRTPPDVRSPDHPAKLLADLCQQLPSFHEALLKLSNSQAEIFNRAIQELVSLLLQPDLDETWQLWIVLLIHIHCGR